METTRQLRAGMTNSNRPDGRQPYITGVSAFSSPEDRATALASGMDAYIVKPYSKFDFQIVLLEASARMMEKSKKNGNKRSDIAAGPHQQHTTTCSIPTQESTPRPVC